MPPDGEIGERDAREERHAREERSNGGIGGVAGSRSGSGGVRSGGLRARAGLSGAVLDEPTSVAPQDAEPNQGRSDGANESTRSGRMRDGWAALRVDAPPTRSVAARAWWTVAGLTILFWAFLLYGYVDIHPWVILCVLLLGVWGLATTAASWTSTVRYRRWGEGLAWATLALAIGAFLVWSYLQMTGTPAYGTDEIAFDQYAAQLLAHGTNPYAHSMAPALSLFHVSPNGYTFALNGQPVTSLSYPALSVLAYVPFVLLGWTTQMAVVINVIAWAIGMAVIFWLLPRQVRPLAIVVGSLSVYIGYAVGGVTDALFVPLLVGAVYAWDRFPTARGWAAWRGPVLLGLAMAVKQTPWLVLPFLVAGVALEARRRGSLGQSLQTAARYLAIALGAFLVPNLPFMVMDVNAWARGVLTPVASHAVPAGQGVVGLSLFLGIGGGSLALYTVTLIVVLVVLVAGFVATYPASKVWAVVCPTVVLFFSARSYGSYLVTLLPAAAVAALTVTRVTATAGPPVPNRAAGAGEPTGAGPSVPKRATRVGEVVRAISWRWWVLGGGVAAIGASITALLLVGPPLSIRISSVRTSGQLATVEQVKVDVTNETGSPVRPAFSVESGGNLTTFWLTSGDPAVLAPHATRSYTLLAPNFFAQPPITGGFQVVAFTSRPGTVSRSDAYLPTIYHLGLAPQAVNRTVPVGQPVTVRAEVLDQLNRPVRQKGIPVYLGQVSYTQQGLVYSQAIVNNAQPGQTPVVAYTDANGQATFVITGTQVASDPVYFEANLINANQFYPYGYSEILPVRFGPPGSG
ncbi:MAG TPA: hypothetical protein VIX85_14535 [Acidimicrobiales bacterium]